MALLYLTLVFNGVCSFFLGEYANMILMRCGALHLIFVGLPSSGACILAFLCNKPLRSKTSGCRLALRRIKEEWGTSRWFLEFDIRKCFHTIDSSQSLRKRSTIPSSFTPFRKYFPPGDL
ncbi:hypothetical protein ACJW31_09G102400 [Castanea mollissima]